jgi:hypothetical protein
VRSGSLPQCICHRQRPVITLATILTPLSDRHTSGEHLAVASANFSIGRVRPGMLCELIVFDGREGGSVSMCSSTGRRNSTDGKLRSEFRADQQRGASASHFHSTPAREDCLCAARHSNFCKTLFRVAYAPACDSPIQLSRHDNTHITCNHTPHDSAVLEARAPETLCDIAAYEWQR